MIYHILNGDSLAYSFPQANIDGEIIVMREALIEGSLSGDSVQEFWKVRAGHLGITEDEYELSVVKEMDKIQQAPPNTEFNLWFEYDLFCQVNMWFILSIINSLPVPASVNVVYTTHLDKSDKSFWNGFGPASADQLTYCFLHKRTLSKSEIEFAAQLWTAYKNNDLDELISLSKNQSPAFPYLEEVVNAHADRFPADGSPGRPERVIEDITTNISQDFPEVFREFWKRESIYGFGDSSLKVIFDKLMKNR